MQSIRKAFGGLRHRRGKYEVTDTYYEKSTEKVKLKETSPLSTNMDREPENLLLRREGGLDDSPFERLADTAATGFEKAKDLASQAAHTTADAAHDAYEKAADMAHTARTKTSEAAREEDDVLRLIEDKAADTYSSTTDAAKSAAEGAGKIAQAAYEKVSDAAHEAFGAAGEKIGLLEADAEMPKAKIEKGVADTKDAARDVIDWTSDSLKTYDTVADAGHDTFEWAYDAGEKAKEEVKEAAKAADAGADLFEKERDSGYDHAAESVDEFDPLKHGLPPRPQRGFFEQVSGSDAFTSRDSIRDQVHGIHDEVDSLIQQMHGASHPAPTKPLYEEEFDSSPASASGRGVSPDERTFDRQGPLTIPETVSTKPEESFFGLSEEEPVRHHGFDIEPRPPTPPKSLDDEEVKPSIIDVGPPPIHKTSIAGISEFPRSILKHSGQGPWVDFKSTPPCLLDLIYWRDPKKSGVVLALSLLTLIVFAKFPLISVLSYLGLAILGGTLGFRLYKSAEGQIKKTYTSNPFQPYLDEEINVPQERVHQQVDVLVEHGRLVATQLRRLFLVEDIVESAKFGLLLWALTYVGCWFSGLCLLTLVVLGIFSVPKFYEVYQEPIDKYLAIAKKHIDEITKTINEKLPPFLKKAAVAAPPEKEKST